jgi:hypothetical protein
MSPDFMAILYKLLQRDPTGSQQATSGPTAQLFVPTSSFIFFTPKD